MRTDCTPLRACLIMMPLLASLRAGAAEPAYSPGERTAPPPASSADAGVALLTAADEFEATVRKTVIAGVAQNRRQWLPVTLADKTSQAQVLSADDKTLSLHLSEGNDMALGWAAWRKMDPRCFYHLACAYGGEPDAAALTARGRYCLARDFLAEADADLHRALDLQPALYNDADFKAVWDAVSERRAAKGQPMAPPKTEAKDAKKPSQRVDDGTAKVLAKLGRKSFMLGIAAGPGDGAFAQFLKEGVTWDLRYQYLSGGANVANWSTWNPGGSFVTGLCGEAAQQNVVAVFTLYSMVQSRPGAGQGEAKANAVNCANADTMKAYFAMATLFFQKAAEAKRPVILHIEPDLWGYMQVAPEFKPNTPEGVSVMVKSTGIPELAKLEDNAIGFGKALIALRDKHAPNVLLAFHASPWGNPPATKTAEWATKTGPWDLIFADFADRDAGWRVYHKQGGYYYKDSDFDTQRAWIEGVHKITGLPLMLWQVPYGNNVMAACNNTPGHFMDVFAPYFLENYPSNPHLAEFAAAGLIGIMFGPTMGDSTTPVDAQKDGVTNPTPVEGNKGEKSQLPDDDGGYIRLRGTAYYKKPLQLSGSKKAEAAGAAPAEPAAPEAKQEAK